jgi:hypothetical protein
MTAKVIALTVGAGEHKVLDRHLASPLPAKHRPRRTVIGVVRHRVLLAATWLMVTVAAVSVAWLAVSRAVANVADPMPAVISARGVAPTPATAVLDPQTVVTDTIDQSGAPPTSSLGPPIGDPVAAAGADASGASGATGVADPAAVASDGSGAASAKSSKTASFNSAGGVVTMSCRGAVASLVSATPNQGYTVTASNSGPNEIEVKFASSSHDSEFHGRCVDGQPSADLSDD